MASNRGNIRCNWLVTHISAIDKKMGEFLTSRGVS